MSLLSITCLASAAFFRTTAVARSSPTMMGMLDRPGLATLDTAVAHVKNAAAVVGHEQWATSWVERTLCGSIPEVYPEGSIPKPVRDAMVNMMTMRPTTQELQRYWGFKPNNKKPPTSNFRPAIRRLKKSAAAFGPEREVFASEFITSTLCGNIPDASNIPECYIDDEDESGLMQSLKCVELSEAMSDLLKSQPTTKEVQQYWSAAKV